MNIDDNDDKWMKWIDDEYNDDDWKYNDEW